MIRMIDLLDHVIRPTLTRMGMAGPAAEQLVLGTAIQESLGGYYLRQLYGPALGIYQMEPATHDDLIVNFLRYRRGLLTTITQMAGEGNGTIAKEMVGNLYYATAMCRAHYYRVPEALPEFGDIAGQARYWKNYYNTYLGRGSVEEYIKNYETVTDGEDLWTI